MKHLSILTTFLLFSSIVSFNAQDDDPVVEDKAPQKFRFGIMGYSTIGWLSPENEKMFSSDKLGLGFGWGLNTEFYLNKTTSFRTGFSLSNFQASINYYDDQLTLNKEVYYVLNDDLDFQNWEQGANPPSGKLYKLNTRKYNISYVNLPLILKLKTTEIGYLTYFGEFGAVLGFKTKTAVDDNHKQVEWDSVSGTFSDIGINSEITDLNLDNGIQPLRAGITLGAGAEYNFSGSTSLFFQANWNYFMTNQMTKEENENYLRALSTSSGFESVDSKSIPGSVNITIGILF